MGQKSQFLFQIVVIILTYPTAHADYCTEPFWWQNAEVAFDCRQCCEAGVALQEIQHKKCINKEAESEECKNLAASVRQAFSTGMTCGGKVAGDRKAAKKFCEQLPELNEPLKSKFAKRPSGPNASQPPNYFIAAQKSAALLLSRANSVEGAQEAAQALQSKIYINSKYAIWGLPAPQRWDWKTLGWTQLAGSEAEGADTGNSADAPKTFFDVFEEAYNLASVACVKEYQADIDQELKRINPTLAVFFKENGFSNYDVDTESPQSPFVVALKECQKGIFDQWNKEPTNKQSTNLNGVKFEISRLIAPKLNPIGWDYKFLTDHQHIQKVIASDVGSLKIPACDQFVELYKKFYPKAADVSSEEACAKKEAEFEDVLTRQSDRIYGISIAPFRSICSEFKRSLNSQKLREEVELIIAQWINEIENFKGDIVNEKEILKQEGSFWQIFRSMILELLNDDIEPELNLRSLIGGVGGLERATGEVESSCRDALKQEPSISRMALYTRLILNIKKIFESIPSNLVYAQAIPAFKYRNGYEKFFIYFNHRNILSPEAETLRPNEDCSGVLKSCVIESISDSLGGLAPTVLMQVDKKLNELRDKSIQQLKDQGQRCQSLLQALNEAVTEATEKKIKEDGKPPETNIRESANPGK